MLSATGSAKETFSNSELNVSDYDRNKLAVVNQVWDICHVWGSGLCRSSSEWPEACHCT